MNFISKKILPLLALGASATMFAMPAQALDIKQELNNQCVKSLQSKAGADSASAKKYCSCRLNVMEKMTYGQMWEIQEYLQSGKDPSKLPQGKKIMQCGKP